MICRLIILLLLLLGLRVEAAQLWITNSGTNPDTVKGFTGKINTNFQWLFESTGFVATNAYITNIGYTGALTNAAAFQPASQNLTNWGSLTTNAFTGHSVADSNGFATNLTAFGATYIATLTNDGLFLGDQSPNKFLRINSASGVTSSSYDETDLAAKQFGDSTLTNLSGLNTNELVRYTTASFLTNWASAVSNLAQTKQLGSDNLTNWSGILTSSMARAVAADFLTNWANAVSNLAQSKQLGDATLTNISGLATGQLTRYTTADYLTNWANSISNLVQTKENGSAVLTNIVATGAITNFNGTQFSNGATLLTIKDGASITNANLYGVTNQGSVLFGTDNANAIGAPGSGRPSAVYVAGGVTTGSLTNGSGGIVAWSTRAQIRSSVDGVISMYNAAANDFVSLRLGGNTAAFPAVGRTNGDIVVFGGDGLFAGGSTNRLLVQGPAVHQSGTYHPSNSIAVATITASITNGGCWVGMLSNALQAVCMSNNVVTFTLLAH